MDPTPLDSSEFAAPVQTFYSDLPPNLQASHFPGTPPPGALEVGYRAAGTSTTVTAGGFSASNGFDLLSTVVHEMGHALGLSGVEPGNYNILPVHLGGLEDVEVLEGGGGHLAGQGLVPYLMCESCGVRAVRRFATATDILVIAEELDMTQVHLDRIGSAQSGAWSSGSTWIGGAIPGVTQDVYIGSIGNIDVDTNPLARNLTIAPGESLNIEAHTLGVANQLIFENAELAVAGGGTITAGELKGEPADLTTAAGSTLRFNQFVSTSSTSASAVFAGSVLIGVDGPNLDPTTLETDKIASWSIDENLTIGESRGAVVNVVNGATWDIGGNVTVGTFGGRLHVLSGGSMNVGGGLHVRSGNGISRVTVAQDALLDVDGQIFVDGNSELTYTKSNARAASIFAGAGGTSVYTEPATGIRKEMIGASSVVTIDGAATIESLTTSFHVSGGGGNASPGAKLLFKGDAFAMNYQIVNQGGRKGESLLYGTRAGFGGETRFEGSSRAWSANIRNDAVLDDRGGTGGRTVFVDSSRASQAVITNHGTTTAEYRASGVTEFHNSASAETATITNHPTNAYQEVSSESTAPRTLFFGTSTAADANISNLGGTATMWQAGRTIFYGNSTAGRATITNFGGSSPGERSVGATEFRDNASAGDATIVLKPGYSRVDFRNSSTAGDAEFLIENGPTQNAGQMAFYNNSNAGTAQFTFESNANGALFYFYDNSSAGQANFELRGNSSKLRFQGNSTASQASFDIGALTAVQFNVNANLGDATYMVRRNGRLDLSGGFHPTGGVNVSAGAAAITLEGAVVAGGPSAGLGVSTWSGTGNATITIGGGQAAGASGAYAEFDYGGHGENATIVVESGAVPGAMGGNLIFRRGSNAENVRVVNQQGGLVDINGNKSYIPKTTMGSIAGAGTILLSGAELETGSRNTDDVISGPIIDVTSTGLGGKLTKVGSGKLILSGTNTYTGLTTVRSGTVAVNGSNVGGAVVDNGGTLSGSGNLGGTLTVNAGGTLAPGDALGKLTTGSLSLMSNSTLNFEIGGIAAGAQYDQIASTGAVSLGGHLVVSLVGGFQPISGTSFNLMDWGSVTGAFTSLTLPSLPGLSWNTSQLYSSGVISVSTVLSGDFSSDGIVNLADYTVWRDSLGQTGAGLAADGNGDSLVDALDYAVWKEHFGLSSSDFQASSTATVPEPATLVLVLAFAAMASVRRFVRI